MRYRQLLIENLPLVERLARFSARRHHLSAVDADEFAGIVRLRLVEDDFAILKKFAGRSALATYLSVVIERLCQDFIIAESGKWRPSAAARRMGEAAIRLERLVLRDGVGFDEAVDVLRTNYAVRETRAELRAMWLALPLRRPRRPSAHAPRRDGAVDPAFGWIGRAPDVDRVSRALSEAVATLPPADRRLLELRFEQDLSVREIAAMVRIDRKALSRRLRAVKRSLRAMLEAQGVSHADILGLVGHPATMLRRVLASAAS